MTLFNVSFPNENTNKSKALILSGCRVDLIQKVPYSEFDELNFYFLNNNDFGFGITNIELSFENNFIDPYFIFYIQCVTIRSDNGVLCKINKNAIPKRLKLGNYTKITKEGKIALGLKYYFRTQEEVEALINCNAFCIEGFLALKQKTNVYGFMVQIVKYDDEWVMEAGNTYRIHKHSSIEHLYH